MLSSSTRLRISDILKRIENGQPVSISERIYLKKFADNDQSVASWVHKARVKQKRTKQVDGIEELLNGLSLGSPDPNTDFNSKEDDLADWFKGAPSWLSRS